MEQIIISKTTTWLLGISIPSIIILLGTAVGYWWKKSDKRWENFEAKLDKISDKIGNGNAKFAEIDTRLDNHDEQLKVVFYKFDEFGNDLSSINDNLLELIGEHKAIVQNGGHK